MTAAPLIYPLPALLGYLLFVGISGRLDPLSRPQRPADRPFWMLGLWTGLVVTLVLVVGLTTVHGQSSESAGTLLAPSGWALVVLILPGLALCHVYRTRIVRECGANSTVDDGIPVSSESLANGREREAEIDDLPEFARTSPPPVAAFLSHIAPGRVDVPDLSVAPSESADPDVRHDTDETDDLERSGADVSRTRDSDPFDIALREERRLRAETEEHLRITRRALGVLAGESGRDERERIEILISLEEELESRIRESVTIEAALDRETTRCAELERELERLNRDTLSARQAARRGNEARERALCAAARSLTLARQALRTRARVEERLRESEEMLASRQATIGSLVSALERARSRSRNAAADVASRAQPGSGAASPTRNGVGALVLTADDRPGARLARKAARFVR